MFFKQIMLTFFLAFVLIDPALAQTAADATGTAPDWFPLSAVWWGVAVVVARQVFEIGFKLIPDDTTNPLLQGLRMILKIASGYVVNKTKAKK